MVPAAMSPSRLARGWIIEVTSGRDAEEQVDLDVADQRAHQGVPGGGRAAVVAHDAQAEGEHAERPAAADASRSMAGIPMRTSAGEQDAGDALHRLGRRRRQRTEHERPR